jgi:hypothetical protein
VKRTLLGDRGLLVYIGFLAASGLALTLSMPWASKLSDLMSYPWRPFPAPFFLTYGFLSACVVLDQAADAVQVGKPRLAFLAVAAGRVALAQVLSLPLLATSRSLFPDSWFPIPLAAGYVTAVCLALSAGAVVLEVYAVRRGKHPAVLRYVALLAWIGAPAVFLAVGGPLRVLSHLSPGVALASIVDGASGGVELAVAFSAPLLAALGFSAWVFGLTRGSTE